MISTIDDNAAGAVRRYQFLSGVIASIYDRAFLTGELGERAQNETRRIAREAAQAHIVIERDIVTNDVVLCVRGAYLSVYGATASIPESDQTNLLIQLSADYAIEAIAGQIDRDILDMAERLRTAAQRVDLYIRSGMHTATSALFKVRAELPDVQTFTFTDRIGRTYKSSKRVQDISRLTYINTYNEAVIQFAGEKKIFQLEVYSENVDNKWNGTLLTTVGQGSNLSSYYDIRDEIFHPNATALLKVEGSNV